MNALNMRPTLVFAEWREGKELPRLLEGIKTAATMDVSVPVVVLVPAGQVIAMGRARAEGAANALFFPFDPLEIRAN